MAPLVRAAAAPQARIRPLELGSEVKWERHSSTDEAHWRNPQNAHIPEYGANAFKSLARSHPALFAAHHAYLRLLPDGRVVLAANG